MAENMKILIRTHMQDLKCVRKVEMNLQNS